MTKSNWFLAALTGAAALFCAVPALGAGQPASWVQETDASGKSCWMYLDESGQPVRDQSLEIAGGLYFFDENGHMLWDWVSLDGEQVDEGRGLGHQNDGVYYCGGPEEGRAVTGWKYIPVENDRGKLQKEWFYFRENGRKVAGKSILEQENGKQYKYTFDEDGVMVSSKLLGVYPEDQTGGKWLEHTPTEKQDPYGAGEKSRWYYQQENGNLVKNRIYTIDGSEYLFDRTGIMRTGLVFVDGENRYVDTLYNQGDQRFCDSGELREKPEEYRLMYFDEISGVRSHGSVTLTMDDGVYHLFFKDSGQAAHGAYKGRLYDCGIRMEAEENIRYQVKDVDGKEYLVNASGKIQKPGCYKDQNGVQWRVVSGSDSKGYVILQE